MLLPALPSPVQMPLIWDRSCTSLGGCPEGTRCAQATQSSLVCDTGLIRDMVEPTLSSYTNTAMVRTPSHPHHLRLTDLRWMNLRAPQAHGRRFGADYPLVYIAMLMFGVLAVVRASKPPLCILPPKLTLPFHWFQWLPFLLLCRGCCRCIRSECRWNERSKGDDGRPRVRRRRRLPDSDDEAEDDDDGDDDESEDEDGSGSAGEEDDDDEEEDKREGGDAVTG